MEKDVFLWRESVYKNSFRCDFCLEKIMDYDNDEMFGLQGRLSGVDDYSLLVCPTCGHVVAVIIPSDKASARGGLRGEVDIKDVPEEIAKFLK